MNTRLTLDFRTLLLLMTLSWAALAENQAPPTRHVIVFARQNLEIEVELATSQAQRETGLMHRTHLGETQGMLFVYPATEELRVWMKNTLLPLDVLFLDNDGRIVALLENLQPCRQHSCPIFTSKKPARYMLELNAGFIARQHLALGQSVQLPAATP